MSADNPVQYVGSNIATGEGERHFFMLDCINSAYTAINGVRVTRFMVYTTSGANTAGCKDKNNPCILPCFGTLTMLYTNPIIIAPLLKADYFQMFKSAIDRSTKAQNHYKDGLAYFSGSVSDELLRQFFRDDSNSLDLSVYSALRVKMGSDYFLSDIISYRDEIYTQISNFNKNKASKIMYPDLTFINPILAHYNFFGIDLSKIPSYRDELNKVVRKSYRPDLFVSNSEAMERLNTEINIELKKLQNRNELDKYKNILGSPPKSVAIYYCLKDAS